MPKMVKCGIIFNANQPGFMKYLKWIIDSKKHHTLQISCIHVNNSECDKIKGLGVKIGTFRNVIDDSDIVFSLGYWRKISKEDIDLVKMGIINFHHSYRLKFQGRHCASWALIHNEKFHGSTMHFIDERIDEGKIIDTDFFKISEEDVSEDIFMKSNELGFRLLKNNFSKLIEGESIDFSYTKSEEQFFYRAKDLCHELHLEETESSFLRRIRALTFDNMPAPYLLLEGKKVFLKLEGYDDGRLKKQ